MCAPRPKAEIIGTQTANAEWCDIGTIQLDDGHRVVSAFVRVSGAASVRLVGPLDGPLWAPTATSEAAVLATTIDAGPPVYRLQVKATSGTVRVTAELHAR